MPAQILKKRQKKAVSVSVCATTSIGLRLGVVFVPGVRRFYHFEICDSPAVLSTAAIYR
jgi:hypothetical protein